MRNLSGAPGASSPVPAIVRPSDRSTPPRRLCSAPRWSCAAAVVLCRPLTWRSSPLAPRRWRKPSASVASLSRRPALRNRPAESGDALLPVSEAEEKTLVDTAEHSVDRIGVFVQQLADIVQARARALDVHLQRLDVAEVVGFLCTPAASMIRGQVIVVDGGYLLPAN